MSESIRSMPELIDDRFEIYRVVTDWEAMREGFIDRAEDLNVTRLALDEAGGFTSGHSAKILCTPPIKDLGKVSLGKMLQATGMALVLVIDDERFAPLKATMSKRKKAMRSVVRIKRVKGYFTKENAGKIRKKAWEDVPPHIRKKIMRKVAKAGWVKRRRLMRDAALAAKALQEQRPDCPLPGSLSPNGAPIAGTHRPSGQPRPA